MHQSGRDEHPQEQQAQKRKVLLVAYEWGTLSDLVSYLSGDFDLATFTCGTEMLRVLAHMAPDVIVLDTDVPGEDGFAICRAIKEGPMGPLTQIILVGRENNGRQYFRACEVGADDYIPQPVDCECLRAKLMMQARWRATVERVWQLNAQIQNFNNELEKLVQERSQELLEIRDLTIFTLAKLAESRDPDTGEHLERMRWYSRIIAEELTAEPSLRDNLSLHFPEEVFRSAPLHDIGKVGIPDSILLKPGRLTPQEFEVMKQHTVIGHQALMEALNKNPAGCFLARAAEIARSHHERFDGSGYPDGLAGNDIPISARVVTVADVFDALTSPRVYKRAVDPDVARTVILEEAGRQFDPRVVAAFNRRWKDIENIGAPFWNSLPADKIDYFFVPNDVLQPIERSRLPTRSL